MAAVNVAVDKSVLPNLHADTSSFISRCSAGNELANVLKNPSLHDLIGGIQSVTLGDEEARRRGVQKSVLERAAAPTFDVAVEILERDRWRVHTDVAESVDDLLRGRVRPADFCLPRRLLLSPRSQHSRQGRCLFQTSCQGLCNVQWRPCELMTWSLREYRCWFTGPCVPVPEPLSRRHGQDNNRNSSLSRRRP